MLMALIFIIEDNPQNARMAAKLLRRNDHTVVVAENGELGLALLEEEIPDVLLVDLGLPDIDGQTVISITRMRPEYEGMPIIAFTAWPTDTAATIAQAYGCNGIISKPINTRTFATQVESFLKQGNGQMIEGS
jgi:two-component system, cell cycle response regulator DivK